MLFNSLEFPLFMAFVLLVFYQLRDRKYRQYLLLAASLFFYGYWKWTYLLLLVFSSGIDFFAALGISQSNSQNRKKFFLLLSLAANFGILAYFKYSLFLGTAFFFSPGEVPGWVPMILPVGISFYTFQAMSYVMDVYRGRMEAEKSWVDYLLFITFFPQLVAGPIERAPHLMDQLKNTGPAGRFFPGILLILSGLFKKLLLADRLGVYVDAVYNQPESADAYQLTFATIFFGFQIYGDFSGYSDIARGCATFFGINLMENFNKPYRAVSLSDFWRRWHISLSGWFRDYLYQPLGGNRLGTSRTLVNLFIVFCISGLWHGANWTFLIWGCWHGTGLIVQRISSSLIRPGKYLSTLFTLGWVFAGWFFFRLNRLEDAGIFLKNLMQEEHAKLSSFNLFHSSSEMLLAGCSIAGLMLAESNRFRQLFRNSGNWSFAVKLLFATAAGSVLLWFGHFKGGDFIYFQF